MKSIEQRIRTKVQVQANDTLRLADKTPGESEERLRLVLEGANLGTWDCDLCTDRLVWNHRLYEMLGRDPERLSISAETFFGYIHKDDLPRVRENLKETLRSGTDFNEEFRIVREDGEIRWLASYGRVYCDPGGRPVRMAGVNSDITEGKRAEEQLKWLKKNLSGLIDKRTMALESHTKDLEQEIARRRKYEEELKSTGESVIREYERRRYLSRRLVEALERERMRISMALHDNIGQRLTIVLMKLEFLKRDAGLTGRTEEIERSLKEMMGEIRDMCHTLRPPVLDDLGLASAIRSLIDNLNQETGLNIRFFSNEIPAQLNKDKALALYRICQESLTNIIRHARAKNVFVSLIIRDGRLILTVEDDGRGFQYRPLTVGGNPPGSLGTMIMRERALQVEGNFRIESEVGKGTQVIVEIPVEN